jgi:serine phosphatase RsbU (regulator of sigma subunit)/CHASE1-domain containing sensor protein
MPDGAEVGAQSGGARWRRRAQSWLFTLAVLGTVAATVGGFLLARDDAEHAVEGRGQRAAEQAAVAVQAAIRTALSSLEGGGAVVAPDGTLDRQVFDAFAADLLHGGQVFGVALIDEVEGPDRAAVEAMIGAPIAVLEDGELVPAPRADTYDPVIAFATDVADVTALGLDYGADPLRRSGLRTADETGTAVVTGLVTETASGRPAVLVIHPLLDADGAIAGHITTELPIDTLTAQITSAVGDGVEVALLDGDALVFGPAFDEELETHTADVEVPGRTWQVVVHPLERPDLAVAWSIVAAGAIGTLALLALVVITERHQRRLAGANTALAFGSQRTRAVQDLAGRLARALSGDEVATALLEHLPAAVGAGSAAIATSVGAGQLELIGAGPTGSGEERSTITAEPGTKVAETLATRRPQWLSSPLAWRHEAATQAIAGEGWALALLPIGGDEEDAVDGVLAVSYPAVHTFGHDEKALLETVAVLAARALSRARRYDTEHGAAVAFQRAALPSGVPAVPGLSIAARYRPGTQWATVGGDWYDVLVVDGRIVFVVGDVVGHGMAAAASMGRLRTAFQTIAPLEPDPGHIVEAISQQVTSIPDAFCTTAVCMVLDLQDRTLTWCRAGHPPPLLIDAEGGHLLDEVGLPPLGVLPGQPGPVHRRSLVGGESLILYTDGVVERRGESLDEGFQRLEVVANDLVDLEPEELIDALLEAMVPAEEQADDVVVLVVRLGDGP